ncbi:hypothetical protein [Rhodohalobacter sp.]|uniref:hypothetical protein n=1 Tax=Rhodohalobacter sp. TaxID=1974210 RepID=UPI002ACDED23|nr:hypothetical protein [Rhodohalobacter sp.]MDZ7756429.1 hypothetical protein [Rhodohalobacter sp.]
MAELIETIQTWFFSLGDNYGVNPIIFGSIYVGAIPFFTLSIAWLVKNYRKKKSIVLPALSATFFFISAYVYLIVAGHNVPLWVYGLVILMVIYGVYSTVLNVRSKIKEETKQ